MNKIPSGLSQYMVCLGLDSFAILKSSVNVEWGCDFSAKIVGGLSGALS